MSIVNAVKSLFASPEKPVMGKGLLKSVGVSRAAREIKRENAILSRSEGFSDLLGYAMFVDDKTLMMKDGALQVAFKFYGRDFNAITEALCAHETFRWVEGIIQFGEDIMIEFDSIREQSGHYPDHNHMSNPVAQLIEQERKWQYAQSGALFETNTYLTLTYTPKSQMSASTRKFLFDGNEEIKDKTIKEIAKEFDDRVDQFVHFVASGNISRFHQLKKDEYTSFLHKCITDDTVEMIAPPHGVFLHQYLSVRGFEGSLPPKIGDKYIRTFSINEYPHYLMPMVMRILNSLAIEFRYHVRFATLSRSEANSVLKKLKATWHNKANGHLLGIIAEAMNGNKKENLVASQNKALAEQAIMENESNLMKYGMFNGTFLLFNEDRGALNRAATDLRNAIQGLGLMLRDETVNDIEAYLGSLPGHGCYNRRLHPADAVHWSYMLPLSHIYSGEHHCPNPLIGKDEPCLFYSITDQTNAYRFTNYVSDVGHMIMVGPTGSGKTTFLNFMQAQFSRYKNARVRGLDKDQSSEVAYRLFGKYVQIGEKNSLELSPLVLLDDDISLEITQNWLEDTFVIQGIEMTPDRSAEIRQALTNLATRQQKYRTFSNLDFQDVDLRKAHQNLNTGVFKNVMNGTNTDVIDGAQVGIDVGAILELNEKVHMPIIMAILNQLRLSFKDGYPTLLIIDEAWLFLDHPTFVKKIKDWLKTLRKLNVSVIFATQSVTDAINSSIFHVLLESCPTQAFLPNDKAVEETTANHYASMNLNAKEIEIIAGAIPKKHYYIRQPKGNRLIDLGLGEVAKAFLTVSSKADKQVFNSYYTDEHMNWISPYLKSKGLHDAANFAEQYLLTQADDDALEMEDKEQQDA